MRTLYLAIYFAVGLVFTPAGALAAPGHVYLLKGLANVFSAGLDNYAAELTRRHIPVTVANHSEAAGLALEAAQLYKAGRGPIVIVGHSLGGQASTEMADIMQRQGAKVALIVNYGPPGTQVIPANVARVVNYTTSVGGLAVRGPDSRAAAGTTVRRRWRRERISIPRRLRRPLSMFWFDEYPRGALSPRGFFMPRRRSGGDGARFPRHSGAARVLPSGRR